MNSNENSKMQYDSCVSRGICSVNPRIAALQSILGLYVSLCAKFCLKLLEKGCVEKDVTDFILNVSAVSVANPEFSEDTFLNIIDKMRRILPEIITKYNSLFGENKVNAEEIISSDIFQKSSNIVEAIKLGESYIKKNMENLSFDKINLYKILFIITKSLSINLLNIESFGIECEEQVKNILKILSAVYEQKTEAELGKFIVFASRCNINVLKKLNKIHEKNYGEQGQAKVSYTTTPSKAILVVGTNIKELENVLEAVKNTEIDVYTHDDMMLAHTFPKFSQYKNLKGQYGHGVENCLIDFATFPGPIILTKYSLKNVENLYRGRLFTTDINSCKGIIQISENDFSKVIESANSAKGFKTGKTCETVTIGYNYDEVIGEIDKKLETKQFKNIVVISLNEDTFENKNYFDRMVKFIDKSTLVILFSYTSSFEHSINIKTCFDNFAPIKFMPKFIEAGLPVGVFISRCNRDTLSKVIFFNENERVKIFLGNCQPIMINPVLKTTLANTFGINDLTLPKQNIKEFYKFAEGLYNR